MKSCYSQGARQCFPALRKWRLTWPLLFVVWAHLSLYSARNVEIFVLLAAPPAAAFAAEAWRRAPGMPFAGWLRSGIAALQDFTQELSSSDGAPRWHVFSGLALAALALLSMLPRAPSAFRAEYDAKAYPTVAVGLMEKAGLFSGVFTPDLWGGYLIYREYPRVRVFMDGRSDFYGASFAKEYIQAMGVQPGWEQYLSRYGVDTILLPPDAPLAGALKQSSGWHLIYDDHVALIFRSVQAAALQLERPADNSTYAKNKL